MLAKVNTFALSGLEGYKVDVEVDLNQGLPGVEMVGLASASVREAKERIRSAIKNVGYTYPLKRITVNLRTKSQSMTITGKSPLSTTEPALPLETGF